LQQDISFRGTHLAQGNKNGIIFTGIPQPHPFSQSWKNTNCYHRAKIFAISELV
jgi:hypothetical protein